MIAILLAIFKTMACRKHDFDHVQNTEQNLFRKKQVIACKKKKKKGTDRQQILRASACSHYWGPNKLKEVLKLDFPVKGMLPDFLQFPTICLTFYYTIPTNNNPEKETF